MSMVEVSTTGPLAAMLRACRRLTAALWDLRVAGDTLAREDVREAEAAIAAALASAEQTDFGRMVAAGMSRRVSALLGMNGFSRSNQEVEMLRQVARTPARVTRVDNAADPDVAGALGVVILEQDGPESKGSFKLTLPAKTCCAIHEGAADFVIEQKLQDGQPHRG